MIRKHVFRYHVQPRPAPSCSYIGTRLYEACAVYCASRNKTAHYSVSSTMDDKVWFRRPYIFSNLFVVVVLLVDPLRASPPLIRAISCSKSEARRRSRGVDDGDAVAVTILPLIRWPSSVIDSARRWRRHCRRFSSCSDAAADTLKVTTAFRLKSPPLAVVVWRVGGVSSAERHCAVEICVPDCCLGDDDVVALRELADRRTLIIGFGASVWPPAPPTAVAELEESEDGEYLRWWAAVPLTFRFSIGIDDDEVLPAAWRLSGSPRNDNGSGRECLKCN